MDITTKDDDGNTSVRDAGLCRELEVVQLLLEKGAVINAKDNYGNTPLHDAGLCRQLDIVQLLLKNGADITARDENGKTPLQSTAFYITRQILRKAQKIVSKKNAT